VLTPSLAASVHAQPAAPPDTAVYEVPRVVVVGNRLDRLRLPGSAAVLDARTLERSRVLSANEALRKLPGLTVRDEEGFGLRPNIGIRGLNPTRSTKVTLLEDGIPLAYAPYGDNASYYHPPIERFESVELMKGASQVLFGPQTVGGLVNYITPTPPLRPSGVLSAAGGSRDLSTSRVRLGGYRALVDWSRRDGRGARENLSSDLDDVNVKAVLMQQLVARASLFRERSHVTYSGLTQAEYERQGPRYNPFANDLFEIQRLGGSLTHRQVLGRGALLTTSAYVSEFSRDWWRQSSTTTDGQGGPAVQATRLAGDRLDPDSIRSIQGRLRDYTTWGIEPRLHTEHRLGAWRTEAWAGAKAHFERQQRRQVNATSAAARTGTLAEDNLRRTRALAGFAATRIERGGLAVTPGLRFEHIRSERENRLPGGARGEDALSQWIPSLGLDWNAGPRLVLYAGVHEGFAPPRTEDIIAGSGTVTEVGPEQSNDWELGARFAPRPSTRLEATWFRNDFRRLIAVGSIAGGSTPLAEGEALFSGLELSGHTELPRGLFARLSWTWLAVAEQTTPFTQVVGGAVVGGSRAGNRQPYSPEHALSAMGGWRGHGLELQVEGVHVGPQFADFANTVAPTPDGQRGRLAAQTTWNLTAEQRFGSHGATVFASIKNLADEVAIVDRTRGIQVSAPRTVVAGVQVRFGEGH
jgi:Fe(3+) dicitrate transport protein